MGFMGSKYGYRAKYRTYDPLTVFSVMFGRIVHPSKTERIINLIKWMTGDNDLRAAEFPGALEFCQSLLLKGPAWAFKRYKSDFLALARKIKRMKREKNKIRAMEKWLAKFEKHRKGFSIPPHLHYKQAWAELKAKKL